jgi:hypothetical protein
MEDIFRLGRNPPGSSGSPPQRELRVAGSVLTLLAKHVIEASVRRLADCPNYYFLLSLTTTCFSSFEAEETALPLVLVRLFADLSYRIHSRTLNFTLFLSVLVEVVTVTKPVVASVGTVASRPPLHLVKTAHSVLATQSWLPGPAREADPSRHPVVSIAFGRTQ